MCTLVRWYTNPGYLHFLYYQHKFNKLLRFYMKKCNHADEAVCEARRAFACLYLFEFADEIDEEFKDLLG